MNLDEIKSCRIQKETENLIVIVRVEIYQDGENIVLFNSRKIIDKKTGKSNLITSSEKIDFDFSISVNNNIKNLEFDEDEFLKLEERNSFYELSPEEMKTIENGLIEFGGPFSYVEHLLDEMNNDDIDKVISSVKYVISKRHIQRRNLDELLFMYGLRIKFH